MAELNKKLTSIKSTKLLDSQNCKITHEKSETGDEAKAVCPEHYLETTARLLTNTWRSLASEIVFLNYTLN